MKKFCPKCGKNKSIDEFHKHKTRYDGHQCYCKTCKGTLSSSRYRNQKPKLKKQMYDRKVYTREYISRIKSRSSCVCCGIKGSWLLQFHHILGKKLFSIANAARQGVSFIRLKKEIRKCIIVCANCHATIHSDNNINLPIKPIY